MLTDRRGKMKFMLCYTVMKPSVTIMCMLMIIVSLIGNVMDMRVGKN